MKKDIMWKYLKICMRSIAKFALFMLIVVILMLIRPILCVFKSDNHVLLYSQSKTLQQIFMLMIVVSTFCIVRRVFALKEERKQIRRKEWLILSGWIALLYIIGMQYAYVTKDKIVCCSWKNPRGIAYSYNDVTKISTGYETEKSIFDFGTSKGDFYYKVWIRNRVIDLSNPATFSESDESTGGMGTELEKLDESLMKHSPVKQADKIGEKYSGLDEQYRVHYENIIKNK